MHENHQQPAVPASQEAPVSEPQQQRAPLEVHPLASIFPPMNDKEFEAFVADVKEKGQLEPIWTHKGKVIDGRHRLRACDRLGIQARTREWDGSGSLLEFVISLNLRRRHLKERQRAMLAARIIPQFAEEARQRQACGKADASVVDSSTGQFDLRLNLDQGRASSKAGELLNVSRCSVEYARKVLEKGIPDLIAAVDACKIAVSTAAALAELPPGEQARLLAAGRSEIRKALNPSALELTPPPLALTPPPLEKGGPGGVGRTVPDPEQQRIDDELLSKFRVGNARLTKTDQGFRLELSQCDLIDEARTVINNYELFNRLLERGVLMVKRSA